MRHNKKNITKKLIFDLARFIIRNIPKGKTFLINTTLMVLGCDYDDFIKLNDGRLFYIKHVNSLNRSLFFLGNYEEETTELVGKIIKPGMFVLDVGCNFGWYTTIFSKMVGDGGRVWAFDISKSVLASLDKTISVNKMENVKIERLALGDRAGTVDFFDAIEDGTANLKSEMITNKPLKNSVQMITADEYFNKIGENSLDFIKCDIDGAEILFLRGAKGLVSSLPILLIEISEKAQKIFGHSGRELALLLKNLGYKLFNVDKHCSALTDTDILTSSSANVLCLSPEKHVDIIKSIHT